jgi:hypothetical protein
MADIQAMLMAVTPITIAGMRAVCSSGLAITADMAIVAGIPDMMIADTMAIRMAGSAMRAAALAGVVAISNLAAVTLAPAKVAAIPGRVVEGLRTTTRPQKPDFLSMRGFLYPY